MVVVLSVAAGARGNDYLAVFSADGTPYRPTKGHTFACVVRTDGGQLVECHSISWLPETMKVRPLAVAPEAGRNVPLLETVDTYAAATSRMCVWGPYRIDADLFESFKGRKLLVEGSFRYKGASYLSPLSVCDCTRSIEEMAGGRRYIGVYGYGAAASSEVVRRLSPWLVEPETTHGWVLGLLGIDADRFVTRKHGDYTTRGDQLRASLPR